jgi:ribosomal protein S12 methylthiotransferase
MTDDVPEDVKRHRLEAVQELQRHITAERYESRIGSVVTALVVEAAGPDGIAIARLPWQADDIDGVTRVVTDALAGSLIEVEVTEVVDDYDFEARALRLISAPPVPQAAPRSGRSLPMAGASMGSFGR